MGFYLFCVVLGLFLFISALLEWEWIYAAWDAAAIRTIFGDGAARIFCGIAGLLITGAAAVRWAAG